MRNYSDIASGIFLLCFCALGAFSTMQLPKGGEMFGPAALPSAALYLIAGGASVLILRGIVSSVPGNGWGSGIAIAKTGLFLCIYVVYLLLLAYAGVFFYDCEWLPFHHSAVFSVCNFAFLFVSLRFLGRKSTVEIVCVAFGATALLVCVFSLFFKVLLP